MGWFSICYIAISAVSLTIAAVYITAWLIQREQLSYLLFGVLAISIAGLAATELWELRAQTPDQYAVALRWLHVPTWSGFVALVGLVYLRLRPRFVWVGGLAVGLRTVSLAANFLSGANLNYIAVTGIEHVTVFGESLATVSGISNPWMLTGQAALMLSLVFIIDGTVRALRNGDGWRSMILPFSLFAAVVVGSIQSIIAYWGFIQIPVLVTPLFLVVAIVMGTELSFGLLRAARAEREIRLKNQALRTSNQRLRLAAEAADAGFWSLDWQSLEIWATPKTRELFGLPPGGDLQLADFFDRVHVRDRQRVQQELNAPPGSDDRYHAEFRVVDESSGVRWISILGRNIGGTGEEPGTLMGVTVDVTARHAAQEELRQQRARLETISKKATLSELSTVLAHELNQPLATIQTNAEAAQYLLAEAQPDLAQVGQILADIISADRRAADVIRHLRGLVERGEIQRAKFSLHDTIDSVLRLLASDIEQHGTTVELNLAPDSPSIQGDRVLIEQVLINLLGNACTAVSGRPAGERRLSIATRSRGDHVLIDISDSGPGLPDPQRVFNAFYSTRPGALGMGLTIARSIVNHHHGHIEIESTPGRGTTVCVSLPIGGGGS